MTSQADAEEVSPEMPAPRQVLERDDWRFWTRDRFKTKEHSLPNLLAVLVELHVCRCMSMCLASMEL